jgi:hypothetical protein
MMNVIHRHLHLQPESTDTSTEPPVVTVLPVTIIFNPLQAMVMASPQMTKIPTNSTTYDHLPDRDPIHIPEGRGHIDTPLKRAMMALSAKRKKMLNSGSESTLTWLPHTGKP